jgi:hypothetical protein
MSFNEMTTHQFDNSGRGPLNVPGFHSIPVDFQLSRDSQFSHGIIPRIENRPTRLTAREIEMLRCINEVTDENHWHERVLNPEAVKVWKERAFKQPLMSERAWD